jgi:hypothetical protein
MSDRSRTSQPPQDPQAELAELWPEHCRFIEARHAHDARRRKAFARKKAAARKQAAARKPAKPKPAAAPQPPAFEPHLAEKVADMKPVELYRVDVDPPVLETAAPPDSRETLARFARRYFGVRFPLAASCPHHHSPLEYLVQSFFHQHDIIVWANRGGGKTMAAAIATMLDVIFRGPVQARVLGGSFDQSDRLAAYIRTMLDRQPHLAKGRLTQKRIRLASGGDIQMLAQSQRAVRGQHVQKIRCDEVDLFDPAVWQAVQFSTRSDGTTRGSIEVLSTLHRSGGLMDHILKENRLGKQTPLAGYKLINWCLWDIIERCDPAERDCDGCGLADDCGGKARQADGFFRIDDAIAIKGRSSRAAWKSEMLCRTAQRDWLVLPEFSRRKHVRRVDYVGERPTFRAIDFGYQDPLVCLWVQVGPGRHVHVLQEYSATRRPLGQHARAILNLDPGPVRGTCVDPSGNATQSTSGKACTEMLAEAGIPCQWRSSTINEGLELIRAALQPAEGEPTLTVHPRCGRLIEALQSYHYPPPGAAGPRDKPVKDGPDHFVDALRYFYVNRMRPIADAGAGRF